MTRCIHCTRCVRFSKEIAGVQDLGTTGRGKDSEIGTYVEKMMTSELSGNLVDLCPVGALTNGPYAFTSRPWELLSTNSIDLMEAVCPNVTFDKRGPEIMRSLPRVNDDVNDEWISDKSRYSYDGMKRQRLDKALVRDLETGDFREINWEGALRLLGEKMQSLENPSKEMLALVGEFLSCETLTTVRDLFSKYDNNQLSWSIYGQEDVFNRDRYLSNFKVSELEEVEVVVLVGCNLKYESPLINAKVLKGTRKMKNRTKVYTIGPDFDLGYKTIHLGNNISVVNQILSGEHPLFKKLGEVSNAKIIVSSLLSDNLKEFSQMNDNLRLLCSKLNMGKEKNLVTHGILQNYVGPINAQEMGIKNWALHQNKAQLGDLKLIYNIGNDNQRLIEYLSQTIEMSNCKSLILFLFIIIILLFISHYHLLSSYYIFNNNHIEFS